MEEKLAPKRKHLVNLNEEEKAFVQRVINDPQMSSERKARAQILQFADEREGINRTLQEIADASGAGKRTVGLVLSKCGSEGVEATVIGRGGQNPYLVPDRPKLRPGRKQEIDEETAKQLAEEHDSGATFRDLGEKYGVSRTTAMNTFRRVRDVEGPSR